MANEVTTTQKSSIAIAANKIADIYISDLSNLNAAVGCPMTEEAKRCAVNAILYLCGETSAEAVQKLPKAQMVQVLQFVTINGLDVFSGQVFLDKRKDRQGNLASIKATPMGNAYEIMTKRFGVDVKTVHPARVVHEGDEFSLPQFDGLKMTNVQFKPTLKGLDGKAVAVYYLIEKTDGTTDFCVATREGVAKNLMAQILNATLRDESVNRGELMKRMEGKSLDELLSDETLQKYISPAYKSPASRESMIITKMKKNALLHYTRDLGSKAYAAVANSIEESESSDMIANNVVSEQNPDEEAEKADKIQDFEVEEAEPQNEQAEPAEAEVAQEAEKADKPAEKADKPAEKAPIAKEKEAKQETISLFDVSDL